MGNGSSRRRRNESPIYAPQPWYVLPPVQPPYHPAPYPQYPADPVASFPNVYWHGYNSQQHPVPNSSIGCQPPLPPASSGTANPTQQTVTVRNAVNIKKGTIRLIKDTEQLGFYLLSFIYDAESSGSFNIFLFAKEDENDCSIKPLYPKIFTPIRIPFERGVSKSFQQASGTGIYLDCFVPTDLENEGEDHVCPLVIRAQTNVPDSKQTPTSTCEVDIGAALPKYVNSQITQAVIQKNEAGDCKVRVQRQIIWVDGVRYELKELYGVENVVDENKHDDDDFGKECVICMSEPRDTAVMPCRHMCMCSGCASDFRNQMDKCPICRQLVESLLKIKVKS